jgi:putative DNA primase/helicase
MSGALIPMTVDDPLAMAWLDRNDLGNAERLVRLAKGLLLWVEPLGWVAYDGKRWTARDGGRMAARLAHDVARHIDREAQALNEIAQDSKALEAAFGWAVPIELAQQRVIDLRKHAVASGDASRTNAMLAQARTLIAAELETFDRDPLALNCQNGTLRFFQDKGGGWDVRLDPHDPTDRLMQISAFVFDPVADCPDFKERMRLVQPDRDARALLQQLHGYFLTGLTSEQKWFIYQGRGGDGKSATNMAIAELMGDYYRHADIKTFLQGAQKSGSDHSSDLARLAGDIRLVTADEPPRQATWDASRLKQVTGGRVTARPMREKEIEFIPRWKLVVEVNPLPAVPSDDDGFWRRCRLVPWSFQFDKGSVASEPMEVVVARMVAEGSGILNWMIRGALKWFEGGRRLPDASGAAEALASYKQSASPFSEWLGDRCDVTDRDALTPSGSLYADFKAWCERAGIEKVPTQTAFGRSLRDRQHLERKDSKGNRFRRGIRLKPENAPLADPAAPAPAGLPPPASFDDRGGGRGAAQPRGDLGEFDDDGDLLPP